MVAVNKLTSDVGVVADCEEAEEIASVVIAEELERPQASIISRHTELGVDVSNNSGP